jgi:hypothetical protein
MGGRLMRARPVRVVLGALLAAAGVAVLAEVAAAAAGAGPLLPVGAWTAAVRGARLGDPAVLGVAAALLLVGLVLAGVGLAGRFRRDARAPLGAEAGPGRWWVARRSAEQYVGASILGTTTATGAKVTLTPGPTADVPWRLVLRAAGPAAARAEVERRAGTALARLGAPAGSTVRVRYRRRTGGGATRGRDA